MKQTAIEWFFDNLKNHQIQAEHYGLYKQAKEMEKEQIIDAYIQKRKKSNILKILDLHMDADIYYNKTYNSKQ